MCSKILFNLLKTAEKVDFELVILKKDYYKILMLLLDRKAVFEGKNISALTELLKTADDEFIQKAKVSEEEKVFFYFLKYGEKQKEFSKENYKYEIRIEHVDINENSIEISGYIKKSPYIYTEKVQVGFWVNGQEHICEEVERWEKVECLETEIANFQGFCLHIELKKKNTYELIPFIKVGEQRIRVEKVKWHNLLSPISDKLKCSYYSKFGWNVCKGENSTIIVDGKAKKAHYEKLLLKELWKRNDEGMRKAVFVRTYVRFMKMIKRKSVWIFMDKAERADDNAEVLLDYIKENEKPKAKIYFIIGEESKDYERLKEKFDVVPLLSVKHKILSLISDVIVTGYNNEVNINPFFNFRHPYSDFLYDVGYMFIEHGVKKDSMYNKISRYKRNFDRVVCSGESERQSLLREPTGLNEEQCVVTGLCRYDRLRDTSDKKKSIVIAPTWRNYLTNGITRETAEHTLKSDFKESAYFKFYEGLLNSERLNKVLSEHGYKIHFIPHATMLKESEVFEGNSNIKVWGDEVVHREIWGESSLFITDYSSAFFDFAYLYKPIIYTQFDYDECYGVGGHREISYFDYERDGFGEVEYTLEKTVDRIIEYIGNGCILKEKYKERIDNFFTYHDTNNCKRVYTMVQNFTNRRKERI